MLYDTLVSRIPVENGWSGDQKFRAADSTGNVYLLRISPADRFDRKRREFARMEQAAALEIPMCLPLEFGSCSEGVYAIHSWINGQDAEEVIPTLSPEEQYAYGIDGGKILKRLHTLPAPADAPSWEARYGAKIDRKIAMYQACPLRYPGDEFFFQTIQAHRHRIHDRPQSYQHGDYHIGNMMIDQRGKLTILDFDRDDYGDPWEEFNRIVWCAQASPRFASGLVDGYFGGPVPMEFWYLLALYICNNALSSLPWAVPFGQQEIDTMLRQGQEIISWYDHPDFPVPTWYTPVSP